MILILSEHFATWGKRDMAPVFQELTVYLGEIALIQLAFIGTYKEECTVCGVLLHLASHLVLTP